VALSGESASGDGCLESHFGLALSVLGLRPHLKRDQTLPCRARLLTARARQLLRCETSPDSTPATARDSSLSQIVKKGRLARATSPRR